MVLNFDVKILIITFLVSLLFLYRENQPSYLKGFPFFLGIAVIVELTGAWIKSQHQNNTLLYNLFSILAIVFYLNFYYGVIQNQKIRKNIFWVSIIVILLCAYNLSFVQGPKVFNTYTFSLCCLVIDSLGVFYFYEIIIIKTKRNLFQEPAFWINVGLILFYTTAISFFGILNYISTLPKPVIKVLFKTMNFVNSLFYVFFIIAFLCQIIFRKSTSNT